LQRKLAAILAADVVGYSRLMRTNEVRTLTVMKSLWSEVVQPSVRAYRGRVFKLMGDGMLAEFGSVVDAANAAEAIQTAANARAEAQPEDRRIQLRIGINLGDVVVDGSDLYGDGVNIAARLQEVAPTGGIAVSATTHEYLRGKTAITFADAGERSLKNIDQPVPIWLWPSTGELPAAPSTNPSRSSQPSIAVLPFQNLSSAPDAEFFADGMTEDVINALSKFRWLFVIARGTMSTYKGKDITTAVVAQELGVRYVMEGSIRQAGQRIRVSAQVIDTETSHHLWTERFDRQLDDIFTIQDEITNAIATAIGPEIDRAEQRRAETASAADIDTWLLFRKAMALYMKESRHSVHNALAVIEPLIAQGTDFAPILALAALAKADYVQNALVDDYDRLAAEAYGHAMDALALDRRDSFTLWAATRACCSLGRYEEAIGYSQEAIAANPNFVGGYYGLGIAYTQSGQSHLAMEPLDRAIAFSPLDPHMARMLVMRACALFQLERYEECAETAERSNRLGMKAAWTWALLPIAYHRLNMPEKRDQALKALFEVHKNFSIKFVENSVGLVSRKWLDPFIAALRELGVPEE
jgi:adenylate cyclase